MQVIDPYNIHEACNLAKNVVYCRETLPDHLVSISLDIYINKMKSSSKAPMQKTLAMQMHQPQLSTYNSNVFKEELMSIQTLNNYVKILYINMGYRRQVHREYSGRFVRYITSDAMNILE